MDDIKFLKGWLRGLGLLIAVTFLGGCHSTKDDFGFDPLASGTTPAASAPAMASPPPAAAPGKTASAEDQLGIILHPSDVIIVSFQDTPTPIAPVEAQVKDDGTVTLIYNQEFKASGKNLRELQQDIRKTYVPTWFKNLTPTVTIRDRFYYLSGEVRSPGRQVYAGRVTVSGAISTAGGFTDYARKGSIWLIRANGKKQVVDYNSALKHPEKDLEVFPSDTVHVRKKII